MDGTESSAGRTAPAEEGGGTKREYPPTDSEATAHRSASGDDGDAGKGGPGPSPLVSDSVSLLDALLEYLGARFRLEGYRLERRGRELFARLAIVLAAGVFVLLGVIFATIGLAGLAAEWLHSRPAGFLVVGSIELIAGFLIIAFAGRRRASERETS